MKLCCCAVAASPVTGSLPDPGLAASASQNAASSPEAGHGEGLTKGAIAGIAIGSAAGAALLVTLAAFLIIKVLSGCLLIFSSQIFGFHAHGLPCHCFCVTARIALYVFLHTA